MDDGLLIEKFGHFIDGYGWMDDRGISWYQSLLMLGDLCQWEVCITGLFWLKLGRFAMWQLFLDRCNASPASPALVDAELPGVLSGKNPQVVSMIEWPTWV